MIKQQNCNEDVPIGYVLEHIWAPEFEVADKYSCQTIRCPFGDLYKFSVLSTATTRGCQFSFEVKSLSIFITAFVSRL